MIKKIGFVVSLLTLSAAMFLASNSPGDGMYELSIYLAYPTSFWVLLLLSVIGGFGVLFAHVCSSEQGYGWLSGFSVVAAVNTLIIALPYLRDYAYATQWDSIVHAGRVANIIAFQRPALDNFYPVTHLVAATFALFTGMEIEKCIVFLPVVFYLLYLANVLFMAWNFDPRPNMRGLVAGLALPLVFGSYSTIFRPVHLAVYMLPLFLAWLFKARGKRSEAIHSISFILIVMFLPFLHPWAVVSTSVILLLLFLFSILLRDVDSSFQPSKLINPIILVSVIWLAWFGSFSVFNYVVRQLTETFFFEPLSASKFDTLLNAAVRTNLHFEKVVSLILSNYGAALLYIFPASFIIIRAGNQFFRRKDQTRVYQLALSGFVIFCGLFSLTSLFGNMFMSNPLRVFNFAVVCVPILLAGWFDRVFSNGRVRKNLVVIGVWVFSSAAAVFGALSSYESPWLGSPGLEFTYPQKTGVDFLLNYTLDSDEQIYSVLGGDRALETILTHSERKLLVSESARWEIQKSPAHFGYGEDYLEIEFENPGYLMISAFERAYYTQVWPQGGRFITEDFAALEGDPAWHKVFSSGDMTIWRRSDLETTILEGGGE